MSVCKPIKLGLATAILASACALSDADDAVRGPAYMAPPRGLIQEQPSTPASPAQA